MSKQRAIAISVDDIMKGKNPVPRLNSLAIKIVDFLLEYTVADEKELQGKLITAIRCLDDAIILMQSKEVQDG